MRKYFEKLYAKVIKKLKSRTLTHTFTENKTKIEFEKDIIGLLIKHKIYDNKKSAIQHLEIVCDVDNFPEVKLRTLILDKVQKKED